MHWEGESKTVRVEIKTIKVEGSCCKIIAVSDISQIFWREKLVLRKNFQQQLTSSLSHEIITPINVILNLAQLLLWNITKPGKAFALK